ncbi:MULTISPECIES: hypothetical protein [Anaerolinea]|uniref:hypothetical protein n=1 Tax=Anaerolinea TaxID=233189 RepID=UPI00260654CC|nr:hypothetical protein [Anaerolinea thermophila]
MKKHLRFWLWALIWTVFPLLACNLPLSVSSEPTPDLFPSAPIPTVTISSETVMPPTSTFLPTHTLLPTPTLPPGFDETFDAGLENWKDLFILTTRAPGGRLTSRIRQERGALVFEMQDAETYLYRIHRSVMSPEMIVEAEVSVDGQKDNGFMLICRADETLSNWYEARVSGTGAFWILRYDRALKEREKKNPYVQLLEAVAPPEVFRVGETNRIRFSCLENRLSLQFNDRGQVYLVENADWHQGAFAGFGVYTYEKLPVTVRFEQVRASQP